MLARQIGGKPYESDPDRFKAKPLTAAEQFGQRAESGLIGSALNPRTYTKGYERYQNEVAKIEGKKSLVDSNPETPGVADSVPVDMPADVQKVPLADSPTMTDQQQYSQAFSAATASRDSSMAEPQTTVEPARSIATASAIDAPVTYDSVPADTSFISSAAETPGVSNVSQVSDTGGGVVESVLVEGGGTTATGAAEGAMDSTGGVVAVGKAVADIAAGRDAGEAVADAAAGYAGAEIGATVGSAVGPVGTVVGGVLGGVLGGALFAKGGEVDVRPVEDGKAKPIIANRTEKPIHSEWGAVRDWANGK